MTTQNVGQTFIFHIQRPVMSDERIICIVLNRYRLADIQHYLIWILYSSLTLLQITNRLNTKTPLRWLFLTPINEVKILFFCTCNPQRGSAAVKHKHQINFFCTYTIYIVVVPDHLWGTHIKNGRGDMSAVFNGTHTQPIKKNYPGKHCP